ncbi:MAG: hypothetical protein K2O64_00180 [Lactobacillus sp.]|nr:hypothetical protein [Lactobacillus sp.]
MEKTIELKNKKYSNRIKIDLYITKEHYKILLGICKRHNMNLGQLIGISVYEWQCVNDGLEIANSYWFPDN